jgi:hypothetical protein
MSYMWFEWTQDDKLSKFCKDVTNVPRKKCINLKWKSGGSCYSHCIMNVMDVNVATRNMITKEQVFQER